MNGEWTIGRVIYRGQTKSIDSNKIVIVIDKDPLIPNGYRIQTAYPQVIPPKNRCINK
ncbi:hypothetical protein RGN32_003735 [Providencia stuartii]